MDLPVLVTLFGVGFASIALLWLTAGLRDREDRRAAESPPPDPIPGLDPAAPAPRYVQASDLRRHEDDAAGTGSAEADAADRDASGATRAESADRHELASPGTGDSLPDAFRLDAGWADPVFATTGDRCVLDHPVVVWCPDGVGSVRELLTLFGLLGSDPERRPPLVLLAGSLAREVLDVLRANVLSGRLRAVAVNADGQAVEPLAATISLRPLGRDLLLADYVPAGCAATCRRWISAADGSWCEA